MIYGIDLSYAQGYPNWGRVGVNPNIKFVYSRVSYGTNPADDDGPIFAANHDACKRLQLPFGAYFFWLMGQDGKAQAEHFLEAANGRYGQLRPVIDVEEGSGAQGWGESVQERIDNLAATSNALQKALGCVPIIYTNADTWDTYFGSTDGFAGHPLWVASFGKTPGQPIVPAGWKTWAIHQYTSGLIIDGINGFVDGDVAGDLSVILR